MAYLGVNLQNSITIKKSIAYTILNIWIILAFQVNHITFGNLFVLIKEKDETERNLLANIIIEARHCFNCRLDDPYLQNIVLKESELFGSQQMIKLHLEHFLIHLIRRYSTPLVFSQKLPNSTPPKITKAKSDAEIFRRVVDYLESHLTAHLTIDQICKDNLVGQSQLQKIFKEYCTLGIIEFFPH